MNSSIYTLHAVRRSLFSRYVSSSNPKFANPDRQAKKLLTALLAAVGNDGILSESIVKDGGISFQEVRLSKDGSKAFVLWSTWKEDAGVAERILAENTSRLKQVASRAMTTRRTPYLEFVSARDDEVSSRRRERDELVRRLDAVKAGRHG